VMTTVDEYVAHHAADIAGAAGHENAHLEKKCKRFVAFVLILYEAAVTISMHDFVLHRPPV
jgi:hypothetical protein